ncbi:GNAT family N-acetyltransferase [Vibrio sp. Of7-15]|uniref:GNAT family N-acetyltransferase n=1 Tax=Vibrio sp. Of7-15 TaxID=2724879 RepID=UPI001EF37D09|nr:GNAT family protein [Vibrio sp. Of7-15]MCG7499584.1 GNAT family N-acetyltransferase [Vibrio sp. Of7-15]
MAFQIETPRLILRDVRLEDLQAYTQLSQHEKYQRFYDEADCSKEKAVQLVQMFVEEAQAKHRTNYNLAITDRMTGQFIGICGLRVEDHQQASIGCGLAREYQVSGFAQEAMSALLQFGFENLNVHRVYAETIAKNRAAILLCKKMGMRTEATFIEHRFFKNQWWDTVVLALLKREWLELTS